jgi:tRNA modification GTPase
MPNVGKSSLLNALAKRDVAIVSDIAGTTRDVIEVRINLQGYLVTLYDTAGLRDAFDAIEIEGVKRTKKKIEDADIIVAVIELGNESSSQILEEGAFNDKEVIVVGNKSDLTSPKKGSAKKDKGAIIAVSAKFGDGIDNLIDILALKVSEKYSVSSAPIITNARYRHHLNQCINYLQKSLKPKNMELIAFDINNAASTIGSITGRVEIEEILDKIFSSFCIGK